MPVEMRMWRIDGDEPRDSHIEPVERLTDHFELDDGE